MLEIFLEINLALLRDWEVLPRPPITSISLDNIQSLFDLFCMPYGGVRDAVNAAIFLADGGDDLVPEEAIKSKEEGYAI